MRTKEAAEVQVPTQTHQTLCLQVTLLQQQNLEESSLKLDVGHVEKKATIEEDVEDRLRQPKMGKLAKMKFKQLTMGMQAKMILPQPKLMLPGQN
ncbi:unnamed protein product [Prunus armeniaca]|uniref:Uncharacterized protein n=1 Tax=Prunus armeniaca TaxID=36596 RepID=A0A6J5VFU6_PRUAR|nr:unnamed protein product [Prunus armeniaca]